MVTTIRTWTHLTMTAALLPIFAVDAPRYRSAIVRKAAVAEGVTGSPPGVAV